MTVTGDQEIVLELDGQRAAVSPFGASLRRYTVTDGEGEQEVVWGYSDLRNKRGGQGDVLIPFPGRVARGRYVFEGETLQLECNDKEGPNAIHGFLRAVLWTVQDRSGSHVTFQVGMDGSQYASRGYPFSLDVRVSYRLMPKRLSCEFTVRNTGPCAAPVGVGFHPYFTVGTAQVDAAELQVPANAYLELGPTLVPTGRIIPVEHSDVDFRDFSSIGSTRLNHCFVDLERNADGLCSAAMRTPDGGRVVTVTIDPAFTALVVYTGDAIMDAPRRGLAVEPMTCGPDAFNHPEWGLRRLLSQESFSGTYWINASRTM